MNTFRERNVQRSVSCNKEIEIINSFILGTVTVVLYY